MKVCAIHQPAFLPWLGYFDKARRADVFVILDRVSYQKSGSSMSSWCNRVKLNVGGRPGWISCPVVRQHGVQIIDTVKINDSRPWRDEIRKTLEVNYRTASDFDSTYALIDDLLNYETDNLADFNINAIRALADRLGCQTEWLRQSALPPMEETASERLVTICRTVGADAYLSGGGASEYLDEGAFERAGLQLLYQNFVDPPYGDAERFLPGLSVIDRLLHTTVGAAQSA